MKTRWGLLFATLALGAACDSSQMSQGDAAAADVGSACRLPSDCPDGMYCGASQTCAFDCRQDRDCAARGAGFTCDRSAGRCVGGGTDSGADAGSTADVIVATPDTGAPGVDAPAADVTVPPVDVARVDATEADGGVAESSPENPFVTDPAYESAAELGGADPSRRPYGSDLGSYRGVVARSNYVGACEPSPGCFFGIEAPRTIGTYGYQYQCVEYVVRFYASALGYSGLRGSGDAAQYWNGPLTDAARRLERYDNGGATAPQADDMIIFGGGRYGHIAVVREVSADSIRIIQQNWFHNAGDGDHRLAMTTTGGRYTVAPLATNGTYRVLGWRRVAGTTRGCPTPGCSGNGTCTAGTCVCSTGYAGANCDRCATGYEGFPTCRVPMVDPCAGNNCSTHGTCAGGLCTCTTGFEGGRCERCASGYVGYPSCARPPTETCNGRDDDGNGVVDDPYTCWRAIYRFVQDSTGARCLGPGTSVPSSCPGYRYEREAFIVATASSSGTYRAVQCSRGTDHIVVDADSGDRGALVSAGYDCSLELGHIYRANPGRTVFTNACPLWRYRYTVSGGGGAHLFTRGGDTVSSFTCEAPSRGWVVTNDACFGTSAPGCP